MLQLYGQALRLNILTDYMPLLPQLPPLAHAPTIIRTKTYNAPRFLSSHHHLLSATLANTCTLHTAATDYPLPSPATRATTTARPYLNIKLLLPPNATIHTLNKQHVTALP